MFRNLVTSKRLYSTSRAEDSRAFKRKSGDRKRVSGFFLFLSSSVASSHGIHIYSTCVDFLSCKTTRPSTYPPYSTEYQGTFTKSGMVCSERFAYRCSCHLYRLKLAMLQTRVPVILHCHISFEYAKRKTLVKPWWSYKKFDAQLFVILLGLELNVLHFTRNRVLLRKNKNLSACKPICWDIIQFLTDFRGNSIIWGKERELGEYWIWNVRRWIFYLYGVLYYTSKVAGNNVDGYMQMWHRKTDTIVLYSLETLYYIYKCVCIYIHTCRYIYILGTYILKKYKSIIKKK